MLNMHFRRLIPAIGLSLLALPAIAGTKSGSFSVTTGSSNAGATINASGNGNLKLYIGGLQIYQHSVAFSGSKSWNQTLNVFPTAPQQWFTVGPVPVCVSGNVGAQVGVGISWTLVAPTLSAGLSGSASASGVGFASASVGVPGYNAGVQLDLRFANHKFTYGMNASLAGLNGFLRYDLYPLNLYLKAFLNAWPLHWETPIASYAMSPVSYPDLLHW